MLKLSREETCMYERQIEECYVEMNSICQTYFYQEIELLQTIPGIKKDSAMRIVAEIGVDLKAFITASAIVGRTGLKPRNDESAGKIKGRKTLHGNKFLRVLLVQRAWAACRTKGSKLFYKYQTLTKRMNHNKALLANARKILVIIWNILSKNTAFHNYIHSCVRLLKADVIKTRIFVVGKPRFANWYEHYICTRNLL